MSARSASQHGNALPVVLAIIVILVGAAGAWFYFKKPETDALPPPSSTSLVPSQVEATEEMAQTTPDNVPAEQTDVENKDPVKIDVVKAMAERAIGDPNAPIKMIEYASLTCSHCAHFHNDILPQLKAKYIDTGKVYLMFREFPLNDPALKATLTARCLPPEQYENFTALLFKTQDKWAGDLNYLAALKQDAKLAGMSEGTFEACQTEPQLKLAIADTMEKAKSKWNISATPTFIVNDGAEQISGAQPLEEFERVFRKVSNNTVGEAPPVE